MIRNRVSPNRLERFYGVCRRSALESAVRDGRYAVMLAWLGLLLALFISSYAVPYEQTLAAFGVPPPVVPLFGDLRAVLGGLEATRLGYDAFYAMPRELVSEGRLIYPSLWMRLDGLGLGLAHANILGVLGAFSFVLVTLRFIGRLNRFEAGVYALILCSPPAWLLFERANVDIILYLLLFVSLLAISRADGFTRFLGYIFVLLPACLKLLPILTLSIALKESRNRFLLYVSGILGAFWIYMRMNAEEMKVIRSFYGGTEEYAFGAKVLYWGLVKALNGLMGGSGRELMDTLRALVVVGSALVCVAALLAVGWLALRQFRAWCRVESDLALAQGRGNKPALFLDAFRAGATLYLFTFVLGVVFDYKLMFLLLVVPQMLLWIKTDEKLGPVTSLALLGLVATFYLSPLLFHWSVDELVNWLIWAYLLYAFVLTLPPWARALAHRVGSGILGGVPKSAPPTGSPGRK